MAKRVTLKGDPIRKEGQASEAITPGNLVEFGGSNDLQNHSTTDGFARRAFAQEADFIGDGIDKDYDEDDRVLYGVYRPGDEVYANLASGTDLTTASDANISKGHFLSSAGDETNSKGRLKKADPSSDEVVAVALEAVDNSGADADTPARIKVEVV